MSNGQNSGENAQQTLSEEEVDTSDIDSQICLGKSVIGLLVLAGIITFVFGASRYFSSIFVTLGEAGSFIGGTSGPLWSLAALLAIYLGFLAQQKDIRIQRAELAGQKEQLELHSEHFGKQRIDESFFRMLDVYKKVSGNLTARPHQNEKHLFEILKENWGINYHSKKIKKFSDTVGVEVRSVPRGGGNIAIVSEGSQNYTDAFRNQEMTKEEKKDALQMAFDHVVNRYYSKINPYIDLTKEILRQMSKNDIEDKTKYVKLFSATMSYDERILMYHYAVSGKDSMLSSLLREYPILVNISAKDIVDLDFLGPRYFS